MGKTPKERYDEWFYEAISDLSDEQQEFFKDQYENNHDDFMEKFLGDLKFALLGVKAENILESRGEVIDDIEDEINSPYPAKVRINNLTERDDELQKKYNKIIAEMEEITDSVKDLPKDI